MFKAIPLIWSVAVSMSISAQCIGSIGAPLATTPPVPASCGGARSTSEWAFAPAASLAASNGPGIAVSTASSLIPAGVSVLSNNAYEGTLAVGGALPFLGTIAIEGALPTAGAGAVAYDCGNGAIGITAENMGVAGFGDITGSLGYGAISTSLAAVPLATAPLTVAPPAIAPMVAAPLVAAPLAVAPCAGSWDTVNAATEWGYAPAASLAASNGPGVAVSTASPIIPAGVSVLSENAYEGALAVGGVLPYLGTVAFDGVLPTAGTGTVAYGCGNGAVGITVEDIRTVSTGGIAAPLNYGAGLGSVSYGPALAEPVSIVGLGCGYGAIY